MNEAFLKLSLSDILEYHCCSALLPSTPAQWILWRSGACLATNLGSQDVIKILQFGGGGGGWRLEGAGGICPVKMA